MHVMSRLEKKPSGKGAKRAAEVPSLNRACAAPSEGGAVKKRSRRSSGREHQTPRELSTSRERPSRHIRQYIRRIGLG